MFVRAAATPVETIIMMEVLPVILVAQAHAMTRTMTLLTAVAAVFLVMVGLVLTEHALVVAGLALTVRQEIQKLALAAAV